MYLISKWESSAQKEVIDHVISLMSKKYYKKAFCFVLEIYAEDSETQKYINLLAKKLNISEGVKSLMDLVYRR